MDISPIILTHVEMLRSKLPLRILSSVLVSYLTFKLFHRLYGRFVIRSKLASKRLQLENDRAAFFKHVNLTEGISNLWELEVDDLLAKLNKKELSPVDVLNSYKCQVKRNLSLNCIAEVLLDAEARASALVGQTPCSPLFGLPVSCKENLQIRGYDSPYGLVKNTGQPAREVCVIVKVLKEAGAVPFVTTSMSPMGISMDASNAIYGRQRHPMDKHRLAGGSSGGEAILIACGASPLGFGSDIAGSLRIPAAFCGLSTLKPTSRRISNFGLFSLAQKMSIHIRPTVGPLARRVQPIIEAMRTVLTTSMFNLDPQVAPLPFDELAFSGKSKPVFVIGYYTSLTGGQAQQLPVPSVQRVVLRAKRILEDAGHELVQFQPPDPDIAARLIYQALFLDGGKKFRELVANEPVHWRLKVVSWALCLPRLVRLTFATLLGASYNSANALFLQASCGLASVSFVTELLERIADYQNRFARSMLHQKIDAIICPPSTFPAPLESTPDLFLSPSLVYVALYNLLDYPAGVVPVDFVRDNDLRDATRAYTQLQAANDRSSALIAQLQGETLGLPLTVQVVGRPFQEETVLRLMQTIENGAQFWN